MALAALSMELDALADPPPAAPEFAGVFRRHAPTVLRALRYLGVASADVEDVAQEVFMVVHRRLPELRHPQVPATWVYRVCVHTAADYRKRAFRRREQLRPEVIEAERGSLTSPPPAVLEARESLSRLLGVLDERKREVVVLHDVEGLTVKEIAETLACPLQTVYTRLRRAREEIHTAAQRLEIEVHRV